MTMFKKVAGGKAKPVNKNEAEEMVKKARQQRDRLNQTEEKEDDDKSGQDRRKDKSV
jgi:hypothetical protein